MTFETKNTVLKVHFYVFCVSLWVYATCVLVTLRGQKGFDLLEVERILGRYELLDMGTGNQTWVLWSRKCSWVSPDPQLELLLGDMDSPEHQEVSHMKKKTVEFNLNIPENTTGHPKEPRSDQRPASIHTILKEHIESHPTLENRSVHWYQELYSLCL